MRRVQEKPEDTEPGLYALGRQSKKSLTSIENVARLSIKFRVRSDLKPRRIVQMRAHELECENAHANYY
jgi:hypothetical protein